MTRCALRLICLLLLCLPTAAVAAEPTNPEEEGRRQLSFGWDELQNGGFHDALKSAESALRLYPALYEAMVVKALAYEGLEDLRRAESWLQTYLELIGSSEPHPQAVWLGERLLDAAGLEQAPTGEVEPAPAEPEPEPSPDADPEPTPEPEDPGLLPSGDGFAVVGAFGGFRGWSQTPCDDSGCEGVASQSPGFLASSALGGGGGLTVRAEYWVLGWFVAPQVRYDLLVPPALTGLVVSPAHRLDLRAAGRMPLLEGEARIWLTIDLGYGMRSWSTLQASADGQAVGTNIASSQVVGGIGVRIEPVDRLGILLRGSLAGLLAATGGINEVTGEAGVYVRALGPLQFQAGLDVRRTTLLVEAAAGRAELIDLSVSGWVGVGVTF